MDFIPPPPPPLEQKWFEAVCNVKIVYGNLKSENSQRNCMSMNSASVYVLQISCKTGFNEFPLEISREETKTHCSSFPPWLRSCRKSFFTVIPSEQTFPVKTLPWAKTTKLKLHLQARSDCYKKINNFCFLSLSCILKYTWQNKEWAIISYSRVHWKTF